MPDILKKYKLQIPNYSSLWLPSVALNAITILEQLPEDEREIAVIGYDDNFSRFMGNHVLAVDLSMGFATFVFWEDDLRPPPNSGFLFIS